MFAAVLTQTTYAECADELCYLSAFSRYAGLSERVQELAGIGNKGQRMAQLALQQQGKR